MSVRVMETQISEIQKKEIHDEQIGTCLLKNTKSGRRLFSKPKLHVIIKAESNLPVQIRPPPKNLKTREKHDRNIKFEANSRKV